MRKIDALKKEITKELLDELQKECKIMVIDAILYSLDACPEKYFVKLYEPFPAITHLERIKSKIGMIISNHLKSTEQDKILHDVKKYIREYFNEKKAVFESETTIDQIVERIKKKQLK